MSLKKSGLCVKVVTNLEDLQKLLEDAQNKAEEFKKTIDAINKYVFEIKLEMAKEE